MISIKWPLFKKTKRLILRPLEISDYENWRQSYTNMHPARNEWDESPWADSELTLKKFKELLKNQKDLSHKDQFYEMGIFRKDDGVFIGVVSLMDVSRKIFQNAYLGYKIFNIYWGQGYASEACRGMLEIGFKDLGLHRIEAGIGPSNKLSIRVAKAIGLRKEGLSRKRLFVDKQWVDVALYAATCEDFGLKFKPKTKRLLN